MNSCLSSRVLRPQKKQQTVIKKIEEKKNITKQFNKTQFTP